MITATLQQIDLWRMRHRFCNDESGPMSLDEARVVLGQHAGHGGCRQYLDALKSVSAVMA